MSYENNNTINNKTNVPHQEASMLQIGIATAMRNMFIPRLYESGGKPAMHNRDLMSREDIDRLCAIVHANRHAYNANDQLNYENMRNKKLPRSKHDDLVRPGNYEWDRETYNTLENISSRYGFQYMHEINKQDERYQRLHPNFKNRPW